MDGRCRQVATMQTTSHMVHRGIVPCGDEAFRGHEESLKEVEPHQLPRFGLNAAIMSKACVLGAGSGRAER